MIVDTPPGFTPEVIAAIDISTDVCMVGTLDTLSLKNTQLGLETSTLMGYPEANVSLVLNRAQTKVGISADDVARSRAECPTCWCPATGTSRVR